ncbi:MULTISPECIES: hypothetical protein [Streptomyces]|uniref:hypothetical protein n=1 Tax=Streptomyces TaxID=1883 RepID=UPI000699F5B9|nr:hypothetical protein [Streptomyces sp. SID7805]MYU56696.1 hypothetical protein [Streptomyces sp. SID7805]
MPELITWSPPPGDDVTAVAVGRPWAAVSAPARLSAEATRLGLNHAAHILDLDSDRCIWLTDPVDVAATAWDWARISRYITVHPAGEMLPLPHADRRRGPGPRWVCPAPWYGDFVSRAIVLGSELGVITLEFGPPACRCAVCPAPVWPEEGVTVAIPTRPGGEGRHLGCTHRACAERYLLGPPDADGYR